MIRFCQIGQKNKSRREWKAIRHDSFPLSRRIIYKGMIFLKYRLCDPYRLEGWKGLPSGVYDPVSGETFFLAPEQYRLLLHMDGVEDLAEDDLTPRQKEIIQRLLSEKLIRSCDRNEPLAPEQKYRFFNRTYIAYVHWAITGKCNYRCKHCYMYAPEARFPEPTMDQCRKIIRSMKDAGVRSIALTGGEPLVRGDFIELIDEIVSGGIRVDSVYTNGALVTDRLLDELDARGQKPRFHISFDGMEYHDWLRGIPGARDSALRAIDICRAHGNEVYAAMCVHRKNRHELFETVRFLASRGVCRTRIKFMLPNGMWADGHAADSLNVEEATDTVAEFIDAFFAHGMPAGVIVDNMFQYHQGQKCCVIPYARHCRQDAYLCTKAAVTPYIGPTGAVLPCMTLGGCDYQDSFPNIFETPLSEIMSASYYRDVTHMTKKEFFDSHEECRTCPARSVCTTGCRACTTRNFLELDQWNCIFLKGGYYRKIDEAIRRAIEKYQLGDEVSYTCITE